VAQPTKVAIPLCEALPSFSKELGALLVTENEPGLASQVSQSVIVDRCRCADGFCVTFYAQPKPDGAYGPGHRCLEVQPEHGTIIVDVLGETIAQVAVLYRDEIRTALLAVLP
jgi:hypothetical protein